jgi:hypothetical protein
MTDFIVPEKIKALQESDPNLLQIGFEAADPCEEDAPSFFEDDEESEKCLYRFGTDGMGGAFALWNPSGIASGEPYRVVYIGEDGDFVVAASSIDDFLMLLSYDFVIADLVISGEEVHYREIMEKDMLEDIRKDQDAYRAWLKDKFGITPEPDYRGILSRAQKEYDGFDRWMESRIDTGE